MSSEVVRAAGAVLWRLDGAAPSAVADRRAGASGDGASPGRLVAVIHRPRYDDWTLPKGKLDPGESDEEAAVREVEEETGQRGEIVGDLGEVTYRATKHGVTFDKVVRYFEMRLTEPGDFVPDHEVDALRWLAPRDALPLLTYERDAEILRRYDPTL